MPIHVSPGVYVSITDLSRYVELVPSTNSLFIFLSSKGRDNTLLYKGNQDELISEYGTPDVVKFAPYGQGLLVADKFFEAGGGGYCMRVMPDDATYANSLLYVDPVNKLALTGSQANLNSEGEIDTFLEGSTTITPAVIFYGIGRGQDYYNDLAIKLTPVVNKPGLYVCDIYAETSLGTQIKKSYYVSFDETMVDDSGESYYIEHVINTYDKDIRVKVSKAGVTALQNLVTITPIAIANDPPASPADGDTYIVGTNPSGDFAGHANEIATYDATNAVWNFSTAARGTVAQLSSNNSKYYFTGMVWVAYDPFASEYSPASIDDTSYKPLQNGSDGSLRNADGTINTTVATQLLVDGFSGSIDVNVINTTDIWFGLVWDGGYPDAVKDAIVNLAQEIRKDCVALVDNGDHPDPDSEIQAREQVHNYNTKYAAIYAVYTYVYDEWTGRYIWVTPLYHLAGVIGGEQFPWFSPAGETNAPLSGIKSARYNLPTVNWRDQFTLHQLNPILKFSFGYTIWGDYTTQQYASKLQNLPCMRLTLYAAHALSGYCNSYIFNQNSPATWDEIRSQVSLFLSDLKKKGALRSFSVDVGADDYELKTQQCHVNVTLEPVTSLHIINLNFFIK